MVSLPTVKCPPILSQSTECFLVAGLGQTLETRLGMASILGPVRIRKPGHSCQTRQEGVSDRQPFPCDPSGPNPQGSKVGYLEILRDLGFSSPPSREQRFCTFCLLTPKGHVHWFTIVYKEALLFLNLSFKFYCLFFLQMPPL